ncbi:type II toxin-antitoxin system PemK/MazF family toxin [Bosea sp. MMO-172]|uniref:type II toxin-antitoxin system PemK/MazF family toxin n=1 Tax=Bosea sp. MMO-172 TaxID=3127885 RepID=UPI003016308C
MKRGDLVTVAIAGDFGKPRPALVVQADPFDLTATVTLLLISSDLVDAPLIRLTVEPNSINGLRLASQIMVDKAMTVRRDRIGQVFGRLDPEMMIAVNRSLALFLGLS